MGKPLQVDLVTKTQIKPSCAWVKVEVDLNEFPKRINRGVKKKSRELIKRWININCDYVPKYCTNCKIQGHNEQQCYILHPELYPKGEGENPKEDKQGEEDKRDANKGKEKPKEQKFQRGKGKSGRDNKGLDAWNRKGLLK